VVLQLKRRGLWPVGSLSILGCDWSVRVASSERLVLCVFHEARDRAVVVSDLFCFALVFHGFDDLDVRVLFLVDVGHADVALRHVLSVPP